MNVPPSIAAGDLIYRTPPDAEFVTGEGVWLTAADGRTFLDAEAANGAVALGYDPGLLLDAANRSAGLPGLPSFCESSRRVEVLERLAGWFDPAAGAEGRISVELGGAQGIETAMRIVAANRGPGPVMVFQGGYHGRSPFTAHLSASARYRTVQPWPGPETIRLPYPSCTVCPHRPPSGCNPACAEAVTRMGVHDVHGVPAADSARPVAALILEPLLNVGGFVLPDSGHLRTVVEHARSLGALIVVDEIFTGLHRLGPRWGFELHGIRPDIVVASKALTNGITPLSCVWAREPLSDPEHFPPGSHSATFAGNPFAVAVLETVLDRWDAIADPRRQVSRLAGDLDAALGVLRGHDLVASVDVVGGLARVQLTRPAATAVRSACADADGGPGLLLASTGMAPRTVAVHPPLCTTGTEAELIGTLLGKALDRVASPAAGTAGKS